MIWANLLHLGYNMWADREAPEVGVDYVSAKPFLRFDYGLWKELTQKMTDVGMNMVVIDLAEGVRYESHPELGVNGSWTVDYLRGELARLRTMGLEPIPKLNFSTTHDAWLGPYSRCVSTDAYYAVCRDLIAEVCAIFDSPRFFHLGMDEESAAYQTHQEYVVVRQHGLWWNDFYFLLEQVEKAGSRAWIWSDYLWRHPVEFFANMPKLVVQSNWYYGTTFGKDALPVKAYRDLEKHGYDQIPTGSNWTHQDNFERTVAYCRKRVSPGRLLGFLQTPWKPTLAAEKEHHLQAIELVGKVIADCAKA